jgi:hypothetical protein
MVKEKYKILWTSLRLKTVSASGAGRRRTRILWVFPRTGTRPISRERSSVLVLYCHKDLPFTIRSATVGIVITRRLKIRDTDCAFWNTKLLEFLFLSFIMSEMPYGAEE